MIAADTSAWLDFSKGKDTAPAVRLEASLAEGNLVMPLPVLFEVLSGPGLTAVAARFIRALPRLESASGFWERAGERQPALLQLLVHFVEEHVGK